MKKLAIGMILASSMAQAGDPVFSFQALSETKFTVNRDQVAQAQYQVTNNSSKPHVLVMRPILGVKEKAVAGSCITSGKISQGQSCLLSLEIVGKLLEGNVNNAPVVCADGNNNMCYKPNAADLLKVTLVN